MGDDHPFPGNFPHVLTMAHVSSGPFCQGPTVQLPDFGGVKVLSQRQKRELESKGTSRAIGIDYGE